MILPSIPEANEAETRTDFSANQQVSTIVAVAPVYKRNSSESRNSADENTGKSGEE